MHWALSTLIFFITCTLTSCSIQGQDDVAKKLDSQNVSNNKVFSWQQDSALVESLFERYSGEHPGASFILIKAGKVEACKAYGYANLKQKTKATPATNYRSASATKQFTGLAIMQLIHQGKLSYDSKLTDIFPDFPAYGEKVSVKHLLVHRSGLIDYMNLMADGRKEQILDHEVLALMKQQDHTLFEPGSKYEYSNSAYAVLAEIIAQVSKQTFAQFMTTNIFEPLGMNNTLVYEKGKEIPHRAYGHSILNNAAIQTDQSTTSAVQGDGGIYTSVLDYYKWDQALYGNKLLPQSAFQKGLTSWYDDPKLQVQAYGNGWRINYVEGIKITHHSGHTKGFTNYTCRVPELNLSFAAFSNRNNEDAIIRLGNTIVALFSEGKLPIPVDAFLEASFYKGDVEQVFEKYHALKKETTTNYLFTENDLIVIGKKLQKDQNFKAAIRIYEFNLKAYPASFMTAFELAKSYDALGEKTKAKNYYQLAKKLIPEVYSTVWEEATEKINRK